MIFRRLVTAGISPVGTSATLRMTPSIRARTTIACGCGSKWMSEAPSAIAFAMIWFVSLIAGASVMSPSVMSSTCSSSSSATTSASISTATFARKQRSSVRARSETETTTKRICRPSARRRSSEAITSVGSVTATITVPSSSNAIGSAERRLATFSGSRLVAEGTRSKRLSSKNSNPYCSARARAIAVPVVTL